jgi:hypothetical protein
MLRIAASAYLFLRALKQLDHQYGLKNVPEIIELSDHFLREDSSGR